jgi:CheY-like chemotaxis protein
MATVDPVVPVLDVALLSGGRLTVDGAEVDLSPQSWAILAFLALAPQRSATERELIRWVLGGKSAMYAADKDRLTAAVHRLRSVIGKAVLPRVRDTFRLVVPAERIDAQRFIDDVDALPVDAERTVLDELLGRWQVDPVTRFPALARQHWDPLCHARDRLMMAVRNLAESDRLGLRNLPRFTSLFAPGTLPAAGPAPRPRILVLDDRYAEYLCTLLKNDFDGVPVTTLDEFKDKLDDDPDFACVVVDLHLTTSMDDAKGKLALEHLVQLGRDIPFVMLTGAPPEEVDITEYLRPYGRGRFYIKRGDTGFRTLVGAVHRLIRREADPLDGTAA